MEGCVDEEFEQLTQEPTSKFQGKNNTIIIRML